MKKRILLTLLVLVVGLIVFCGPKQDNNVNDTPTTCTSSSCPLRNPARSITVPTVYMEMVDADNISITLPVPGWIKQDVSDETVKIAQKNEEHECMFRVIKEPTDSTYAKYVTATLRDFSIEEIRFDQVRQIVINKQRFILAQGLLEGRTALFWITVKDGFGYWFMCGCSGNMNAGTMKHHELCQSIGDSIQIR